MSVRSRYRDRFPAEKPAEEIPASEKIKIEPADIADNPAVVLAREASAKADEATERLRQQIANLHQAEALQRQAMMQGRPMNHAEKLAMWKAQGMSDANHNFLATNIDMAQNDQLTAAAAHRAAQEGYRPDTDGHRKRTRELFDQHLRGARTQAPTPAVFAPPARSPEPAPEPEDRSAFVSAPVSREVAGGDGRRELTPSQVRLTYEQKEAARMAGISEVEYARQMQKLKKAKTDEGRYNDSRYG
jgi:hypothetical protein